MPPSVKFICLRVAYREAFWENWVGLYEVGVRYGGHCYFQYMSTCTVHVIFFHSLPSRVGCSSQGKLFSIFKLLCLVSVRYYLSSRPALESCVLFVIALRSSWGNFFAETRFVLLTQAINSSLYNKYQQNWPYRMFIKISRQVFTVVWSIISHLKVFRMGFPGKKSSH